MKKIFCLLGICLILSSTSGLRGQMTIKDAADDMLVISVNTALYALIGGIGSAIHDEPFWDGFKQGALGGVLIGGGKFVVGKSTYLAWPAKFMSCLGTSIATNATLGRNMFHTLGMDFGPVYLELEKRGSRYHFNPELWLGGTTSLILSIFMADAFDWKSSLATGTLTFIQNDFGWYDWQEVGMAVGNIVWIPEDWRWSGVHSHEIIHTYQTATIAPLGALILGDRYVLKTYNRWHIRIEEDFGILFSWFPETMLIPNNKMPREYEADALVDYFPERPNKKIWER
ncbi:hypothetical protein ACFLT1_06185 [Bacteroidota bacterium]